MTPIARLIAALMPSAGIRTAPLDGVTLYRADQPIPRVPILYEPGIFIVGQGRKRGYLGDRLFTYDANNYLVLSVPLPLECETEASPEHPMLAVSIRVDIAMLSELIQKTGGKPVVSTPQGIYATPIDAVLGEAAERLLKSLANPIEAQILGPQIVREIVYRVLCGEQGCALHAAAAMHSRFAQIGRALQRIHCEFAQDLTVEALAGAAGMSLSAFHQTFKAVTSSSPLQYLKTVRLHKARLLMAHEGLRAGTAAERVGYESQSQFSREFKRLFGQSPVQEVARFRAIYGF